MPDPRTTLTEQLQAVFAAYHKTDVTSKEQRQKLVELINGTSLPSHHKEVLLSAFLTEQTAEVPLALHLLRRREELRHADAMLKIESAALAERMKRERSGSGK